jgi:Secretion system C-terminal sorting domain
MRIGDPTTASNFNIIDRARYGIRAGSANIECFNNVFQNMVKNVDDGIAITATVPDILGNNFTVKKYILAASFISPNTTIINKFFACAEGIRADGYTTHDIQRCDMRSLQDKASVSTSTGANNNKVGCAGITVISNKLDNTAIKNNSIYNHFVGVRFFSSLGLPATTSFGNATISGNTINRINATASTTAFCASGIFANMTLGSGASVPTLKTLTIDANVLNGVYEGINVSNYNLTNVLAVAASNDITLVDDPNAVSASVTHFGLRSANNGGNFTHTLSANTVRGIANTNVAANQRVVNFELTGNSNSGIICNRSTIGYTGFKFAGTHLNTQWRNAITDDASSSHWWVLHLANGNIGDQGNATFTNDNRFGNINGGAAGAGVNASGHTNVTGGSGACLSRIFTRSGVLPFRSTTNSGLTTLAYSTSTLVCSPLSSLPLLASPPALVGCSPAPPLPVAPSGTPISGSIAQMEAIALNTITYSSNAATNKWLADYTLYRQLANDSSSRNATSTLSTFYTSGATTTIKNLVAIEDLLTQGNTSAASALLSTIAPSNSIETNYKNFYSAYVNYMSNIMTVADAETVRLLALTCPADNGLVVFNARAMHNMLNPNQFTMYPNNCSGSSNKQALDQEEEQINNGRKQYSIYPNPASKGFFIAGNGTSGSIAIEVVDAQGKIVLQQSCVLGIVPCYIPVQLTAGVYIVNIFNNETKTRYNSKLEISNQ